MAIKEKYEIDAPNISENQRLKYLIDEISDDPAANAAPPRSFFSGIQLPEMAISGVYDSVNERNTNIPHDLMLIEQGDRCRRLWHAVLLQAFVDICYANHQKAQKNHAKYDAITWIEGGADRDYILDLAGIRPSSLQTGFKRVKETEFDLARTMGVISWRYERDGERALSLDNNFRNPYEDKKQPPRKRALGSNATRFDHIYKKYHAPKLGEDPAFQKLLEQ